MSAPKYLRALGVDWFVDLETTSEIGTWSLTRSVTFKFNTDQLELNARTADTSIVESIARYGVLEPDGASLGSERWCIVDAAGVVLAVHDSWDDAVGEREPGQELLCRYDAPVVGDVIELSTIAAPRIARRIEV